MRFVSALIAAGLASLNMAASVQKIDADIKAADGVLLKATYFSPGRPGPAVILFHQCNMDRRAWDGLANDLAAVGMHVLTFDYRGFGQSGGQFEAPPPPPPPPPGVTARPMPGLPAPVISMTNEGKDSDAVYAYLLSQKGVDKTRIALGGASCGVAESGEMAARHREIKALVLLSGSVRNEAKTFIAATPSLAVFGAASDRDVDASGIHEAVEASKSPGSTLKIYPGTEHGVSLFAKNGDLRPMIVKWLQARLAAARGRQP
jgi:dienelactone hydrolase